MTALQALTTVAPTSAVAALGTPTGSEIQDRFLKLLITQLKNQDPLNPLDNAQITNQLAQISTVNGIQSLNSAMQDLSKSLLSSQTLQSAALIGRTVVIDSNSLVLTAGTAVSGGIELAQSADSVKVLITSSAGELVRQLELGPQSSGLAGFKWDGLRDNGASAASGSYSYQVMATSGGTSVDATPLAGGIVTSVTVAPDGTHLSVDGIGDIQLQQIKSIL
jgi:flagellar basal-body rod modification protein FlgD